MKTCKCKPGYPPVCDAGTRLLSDHSRAVANLVYLLGHGSPQEREDAQARVRACQEALDAHVSPETVAR
jgi:hypothetical protein